MANLLYSILFCFLGLFQLVVGNGLTVRPLPGRSAGATVLDIARRLHLAPRVDDVIFEKSTPLDSSIEDFPLFKYTQENGPVSSTIEIVCAKCYIKGEASAKLTSKGEFDISAVADEIKDAFNETFHEIADYAEEVVDDVLDDSVDNLKALSRLNFDDLKGHDLPRPNIDFNLDIGGFPDTILDVEFKDTEIYVELGITLSSGLTYSLNLYSSKQLGMEINSVFVGIVASIDLILSVEAEIEIETGFHIKLDDTVGMRLALFADEASDLTFNGGSFEFLPVTVATAGVVFRAVLRVGVRTGFSVGVDFNDAVKALGNNSDLNFGVGIEASAYANVAEFITNITVGDVEALVEGDECELHLEQGYQFAIGAAAGATVQLLDQVWGPAPETEIPIFYTAIATGCATSKAPGTTPSVTVPIRERDDGSEDMETTTTTTELTFSALACVSQGLTNCPASLQTMSTNIVTSTLTSVVPDGADVVWPESVGKGGVVSPVAFGTNVMSMTASSGKPKSYTPPPPTPTPTAADGEGGGDEIVNGKTGGVSNKVIIGVTVGIGLPVIAAAVAALFVWRRRRAYKRVEPAPGADEVLEVGARRKEPMTSVRPISNGGS